MFSCRNFPLFVDFIQFNKLLADIEVKDNMKILVEKIYKY